LPPLPGPAAPFRLTPRIVLLTAALILATVMQSLDGTIANVALPHMQGSLSAAQDQITWVLTSYVVTAAICTPLTAFLVNRYGRRRLTLLSIASFTIASMLCGAAQTLGQIVVFRVLQGAAGSLLMPISQAIIMDLYPKEKHASALAVWSMGVMMAPIFGPSIGGYLTEAYSWRWVFYVNLPIGAVALAVVAAVLPGHLRRAPPSVRDLRIARASRSRRSTAARGWPPRAARGSNARPIHDATAHSSGRDAAHARAPARHRSAARACLPGRRCS